MSIKPSLNSFKQGPFRQKGRYYNFPGESSKRFFYHSILMYLTSLYKRLKFNQSETTAWIEQYISSKSDDVKISWIGHASFLIQLEKINIITDPIFGNASWLFKRIQRPGVLLKNLPKIDYVLISHNHRDHMDLQSIDALKKHSDPTFLVPDGNKKWFYSRNIKKVFEFSWWQKYAAKENILFSFLPAYHWSQRGLFDQNKTLWGSWLLQFKYLTIYFGGDTGYEGHFKEIGEKYSIDYALLPIGPCEPHEWIKHSHLSAQEAGQAFLDLGAQHFVPMHWGTFYFGTDLFLDPILKLRAWWKKQQSLLLKKQVHELKIGQSMQIPHTYDNKATQQDRPVQ